ncbi:hypothetical protein FGG08_006681 [Glutinoglossum americanum]|uniref:RNA-binding protein n=1 Tax=Glutinoglossum americanum TaxID=1670608 RepID=A0A9P8KUQ4_9PEZI|nr:hypothetical protein FGG08_006681 [Glutinoglossum americanum]
MDARSSREHYRSLQAQRSSHDLSSSNRNGRMYDDRHRSRSNSRDRYRRSASRTPPQGNRLMEKIKLNSDHLLMRASGKISHGPRLVDQRPKESSLLMRENGIAGAVMITLEMVDRNLLEEAVGGATEIETEKDTGRPAVRAEVEAEVGIFKELKRVYQVEDLDVVRVIRDRNTGSTAFLERNYPHIYLGSSEYDGPGPYNLAGEVRVRIAFSRERDDRDRPSRGEDEWKCRSVTATGHLTHNKPPHFTNSGDSDVSPDGVPSQFLLIRGLEPGVNEELLAKGVSKLCKASGGTSPTGTSGLKKQGAKVASTTADANLGAKEGSVRRVLLVKDRHTDESWRYGFAEFASAEDSQAALTKFNSLEKFTISSKPVLVSYIHAGVFVPVYNSSNAVERFTFSPLSNPSLKLAYWDEEAYVSELLLEAEDPETRADANGDLKEKRLQSYTAAEKEGLKKPTKETEGKTKKRKAETGAGPSSKKAVPAHLQFWYNRHAELHGMKPEEPSTDSTETPPQTKQRPKDNAPAEATLPVQSFADLSRNCCLLCSRQFKTRAEVNKHERLSQLHRDNMSNDELKAKALVKLARVASSSPSSPPDTGPQYRDRAKERRSAFNQPTRPTPESNSSKAKIAIEKEVAEPPPPSKGAALLNKMGWTAGAGLGAQGTGMLAPIQTEMYVQGVGLGAAGGKLGDAAEEASRKTRGGYSEFLERTRDKAKERFEGMS